MKSLLSLTIFFLSAQSLASDWSFSGYLKTAPSQSEFNFGTDATVNSWLNEGSLNATKDFGALYFESAAQIQSWTSQQLVTKSYHYRIDPNSPPTYNSIDTSGYHDYNEQLYISLNRLNLEYRTQQFSLDVGRQALTLGISKISSPFQLVNPFSLYNYDLEQWDGVDAGIIKTELPRNLFLRAGQLAGNEDLGFAELKKEFSNFSIIGYLQKYKSSPLGGFSFLSNIGGAGIYAEISSTQDNDLQKIAYQNGTIGFDYQFKNTLYMNFEYLYNGSGSSNSSAIPQFWFRPFKNKNYIISHFMYELTPLVKLDFSSYYNIFDRSNYSLLKIEYNFKENMYLVAACGMSNSTNLQTEFSMMPNLVYIAMKYFY